MTLPDDVIAGATKGLLSYSEDKVKEFVRRFQNRDLHFIKDIETEDSVLEQRRSAEFQTYKQYVKDPQLKIIVSLGLTLRSLKSKIQQRSSLRTKIRDTYGLSSLHVAEFVENEQFARVLPLLLPHVAGPGEMRERVETLLREIEKYVLFVQSADNVLKKTDEAATRVLANNPGVFVLYAKGSACAKLNEIVEGLRDRVSDYAINTTQSDNICSCVLTRRQPADDMTISPI